MLSAEDTTALALLYHLNSEPWVNEDALETIGHEVQYKENANRAASIALPPVSESPLAQLLGQRYSCRDYLPREIPLADLSALLRSAYAIIRLSQLPDGGGFFSRSVPSAGGLYPLEVYAVLQRVQGIADGVYHYDIRGHSLEPLRHDNCFQELSTYLIGQYLLLNANLVIIFSAVFRRTLCKYGARGYRYILLEAGHAAQNLCLLASEHGLGSICIGGFFDTHLNRLLGLDGATEAALYCVGVGYPAT